MVVITVDPDTANTCQSLYAIIFNAMNDQQNKNDKEREDKSSHESDKNSGGQQGGNTGDNR